MWWGLVAPMIGAVTTGLDSIQARATCARGTPRSPATSADPLDDGPVGLGVDVERRAEGVGL